MGERIKIDVELDGAETAVGLQKISKEALTLQSSFQAAAAGGDDASRSMQATNAAFAAFNPTIKTTNEELSESEAQLLRFNPPVNMAKESLRAFQLEQRQVRIAGEEARRGTDTMGDGLRRVGEAGAGMGPLIRRGADVAREGLINLAGAQDIAGGFGAKALEEGLETSIHALTATGAEAASAGGRVALLGSSMVEFATSPLVLGAAFISLGAALGKTTSLMGELSTVQREANEAENASLQVTPRVFAQLKEMASVTGLTVAQLREFSTGDGKKGFAAIEEVAKSNPAGRFAEGLRQLKADATAASIALRDELYLSLLKMQDGVDGTVEKFFATQNAAKTLRTDFVNLAQSGVHLDDLLQEMAGGIVAANDASIMLGQDLGKTGDQLDAMARKAKAAQDGVAAGIIEFRTYGAQVAALPGEFEELAAKTGSATAASGMLTDSVHRLIEEGSKIGNEVTPKLREMAIQGELASKKLGNDAVVGFDSLRTSLLTLPAAYEQVIAQTGNADYAADKFGKSLRDGVAEAERLHIAVPAAMFAAAAATESAADRQARYNKEIAEARKSHDDNREAIGRVAAAFSGEDVEIGKVVSHHVALTAAGQAEADARDANMARNIAGIKAVSAEYANWYTQQNKNEQKNAELLNQFSQIKAAMDIEQEGDKHVDASSAGVQAMIADLKGTIGKLSATDAARGPLQAALKELQAGDVTGFQRIVTALESNALMLAKLPGAAQAANENAKLATLLGQMLAKLGGARAGGGDVVAGQSYLVGEERAEMFTAPSNGYVSSGRATGIGGSSSYWSDSPDEHGHGSDGRRAEGEAAGYSKEFMKTNDLLQRLVDKIEASGIAGKFDLNIDGQQVAFTVNEHNARGQGGPYASSSAR